MFAKTAKNFDPPRGLALSLILAVALALAASGAPAEPLYPAALMNWMVEGSFHALIVDKSEQRLHVWHIRDGEPRLIESYRCSTGEKDGDKWVRGDMRTPEGVYFFCSVIDGRKLPPKYGVWAFTTDYPNFVDRRRGKSGDGIWLHGRDKPLASRPDSNGCIALENADLIKVSRFIRLQSTPLIVVKKMIMEPRSRIIERERDARAFIESWRQAWESQNLERYMSHYSRNFQSGWLDYASWKEKKRKLIERYAKIRVKLGTPYIFRENGLVTGIFTQAYKSDGFSAVGIKILYMTHEGGYRIYSEDFHQQVDDAFPVRVLLAKAGGWTEPEKETEARPEFRIRLVSTDEPEAVGRDDIESPRPVAPSRAVVLDTLAMSTAKAAAPPALDTNEMLPGEPVVEATVVARLVPEDGAAIEEPGARRTAAVLSESPAYETHVAATDGGGGTVIRCENPPTAAAVPVHHQQTHGATEPKQPKTRSSDVRGEDESAQVRQFLKKWESAWMKKDLDRYMKMYHPDFRAGDLNYDKLRKSKKAFFRKYGVIKVELDQVEISRTEGRLHVKFHQTFQGDDYRDKGWKTMVLVGGKGESFRIVEEHWSKL
ncbi:MAG: L,D-transpeptidase family protein [Desulfomonile sp.]|nr:L,D-transpeptidase family protein [Desulfomonile sp.]